MIPVLSTLASRRLVFLMRLVNRVLTSWLNRQKQIILRFDCAANLDGLSQQTVARDVYCLRCIYNGSMIQSPAAIVGQVGSETNAGIPRILKHDHYPSKCQWGLC
jgi:hypothetical protein